MVRHHVPIRELVFLANSKAGYYGGLPNFEELSDSLIVKKILLLLLGIVEHSLISQDLYV